MQFVDPHVVSPPLLGPRHRARGEEERHGGQLGTIRLGKRRTRDDLGKMARSLEACAVPAP